MYTKRVAVFLIACICFVGFPVLLTAQSQNASSSKPQNASVDLSAALLVLPSGMNGPEKKASEMLLDEVEKRSWIRWTVSSKLPQAGAKGVVLGQTKAIIRSFPLLAAKLKAGDNHQPEGYQILTLESGLVIIAGNDARGVLFGAGRLLRLMDYSREKVVLPTAVNLSTAPKYPLRGHQLGYRPKTNSYDGWSVPMWEQYIRDLVIFGTNAIELLPPITDDDITSPQFPMDPMKMMIKMSGLAKAYGIECWIWYPAMDKDYGDKATVNKALKEWGDVLRQLPQVDAVFVPGGDPGHTSPKNLFPMLEQQTAQLKKLHPGAKMWMSPQGFNAPWMDDFYTIMQTEPAWLEGIVFGPQQFEPLDDLRAKIPKRFKMRFYPDITHSAWAQYPVPDWDFAFAATLNREPINPRPVDELAIFKRVQPIAADGFITYSEGCNDDVNKMIWSSLGWNPDASVDEMLLDYSRYFIGSRVGESFSKGLLNLERNWRGALAENQGVQTTLSQFQELERTASPSMLQNWRFQQALYRAYYDATDRSRLLQETAQEEKAMEYLRNASSIGSLAAIANAELALAKPDVQQGAQTRARVFELAEALFQSIHMQLSVSRYKAIGIRRGANLDLIDFPLSNAPWLLKRFAEVKALGNEPARMAMIDGIVNWSNPGKGGFYDDLGKAGSQPHLVKGSTYAEDPAMQRAPASGMVVKLRNHEARISSSTYAETIHDYPLEMRYPELDKSVRYRLRIVYGPEGGGNIRLVANDNIEIHPMRPKEMNYQPVEFELPAEATNSGVLRLKWNRPPGIGGSGRGVQVAEVWLMPILK